ncbi:MAG: single-stranded DNA-binding protein [Planctomycetota bacterium]|nr:single-stranded DNA-binding protein [Planctomycetota bacterium]
MNLPAVSERLARALKGLRFGPPVTHVYNPLEYARAPHERYLKTYGSGTREIVLLGMNPGPFGMAQTGVPFGEVGLVRDWLKLEAPVGKPANEHPKRPIEGFACPRSEVSGARLWGWAKERFGAPERFFARFFVVNYCPLVFMESGGANRTPDKLPEDERAPVFAACDEALRATVDCLKPKLVVGVGEFARGRAEEALKGMDLRIGRILHPSPASPAANRGWAQAAEKQLQELGVDL